MRISQEVKQRLVALRKNSLGGVGVLRRPWGCAPAVIKLVPSRRQLNAKPGEESEDFDKVSSEGFFRTRREAVRALSL